VKFEWEKRHSPARRNPEKAMVPGFGPGAVSAMHLKNRKRARGNKLKQLFAFIRVHPRLNSTFNIHNSKLFRP